MRTPRWMQIPRLIAILIILGGVGAILCKGWSSGWGIFIFGVGALIFALLSLIAQVQFLKRARHTIGTIIAYKEVISHSSEGISSSWHPIVSYTLPGGQGITFQSRTSYILIRKSMPVSTKVGVLYDPYYPKSAMINRPLEKLAPYIIMLIAIACIVLGMLMFVGRASL